jgi:hypothetical protein
MQRYLPPFETEKEVIFSVLSAAKWLLDSNNETPTWKECLLLVIRSE